MPFSPELEDAFGPRVDKAVDKVGGLLPVEWSTELRSVMRDLVADAYVAGAGHLRAIDVETRRAF
jgi:hypothetical protein